MQVSLFSPEAWGLPLYRMYLSNSARLRGSHALLSHTHWDTSLLDHGEHLFLTGVRAKAAVCQLLPFLQGLSLIWHLMRRWLCNSDKLTIFVSENNQWLPPQFGINNLLFFFIWKPNVVLVVTSVKSHITLMLLFLPILIATKFHEWISISKNPCICNRNLNSKVFVCLLVCFVCVLFHIIDTVLCSWLTFATCWYAECSCSLCFFGSLLWRRKVCVKPIGSLFWNTNWKRFVQAIFLLLRGEKTVKDGMCVLDQWSISSPESMEVNQKSFHWLSWILEHVLCV